MKCAGYPPDCSNRVNSMTPPTSPLLQSGRPTQVYSAACPRADTSPRRSTPGFEEAPTGGSPVNPVVSPGDTRLSNASPLARTAVKIVADVFSMSPNEATNYLRQFQFHPQSLLNETNFARHLEDNLKLPRWAEPLRRKTPQPDAVSPVVNWPQVGPAAPASRQAVDNLTSHPIKVVKEIHLGCLLAEGAEGIVYQDSDPEWVIKIIKDAADYASNTDDDVEISDSLANELHIRDCLDYALFQAALFRRYYGDDAAEVLLCENLVGLRMLKIPGTPLSRLAVEDLPANAWQLFIDMIGRLHDLGIWHGDLHEDNIFYDKHTRLFYPIDFSNSREVFFSLSPEVKNKINLRDQNRWREMQDFIAKAQTEGRSAHRYRPYP